MATLVPDATKNAATNAVTALITHLALHEGSPGTTGAGEAAGGTPPYARRPVTFTGSGTQGALGATLQPATPGVNYSSEVTFDVDAASYGFWGGWSAASAGTYVIGNGLQPGTITAAGQGQVKLWVAVGPTTGV